MNLLPVLLQAQANADFLSAYTPLLVVALRFDLVRLQPHGESGDCGCSGARLNLTPAGAAELERLQKEAPKS